MGHARTCSTASSSVKHLTCTEVAARQVCVIVLRRASLTLLFRTATLQCAPVAARLQLSSQTNQADVTPPTSTGLTGALNRLVLNKHTCHTRVVPAADVHYWDAEPEALLLYPTAFSCETAKPEHCQWQVLCGAARASVLQKTSLFQNSDQGYRYSIRVVQFG